MVARVELRVVPGGPVKRGGPLRRRTRLKPVSDKKREAAPERQTVRQQVLERDKGQCRIAPFLPDDPCFGPRPSTT